MPGNVSTAAPLSTAPSLRIAERVWRPKSLRPSLRDECPLTIRARIPSPQGISNSHHRSRGLFARTSSNRQHPFGKIGLPGRYRRERACLDGSALLSLTMYTSPLYRYSFFRTSFQSFATLAFRGTSPFDGSGTMMASSRR